MVCKCSLLRAKVVLLIANTVFLGFEVDDQRTVAAGGRGWGTDRKHHEASLFFRCSSSFCSSCDKCGSHSPTAVCKHAVMCELLVGSCHNVPEQQIPATMQSMSIVYDACSMLYNMILMLDHVPFYINDTVVVHVWLGQKNGAGNWFFVLLELFFATVFIAEWLIRFHHQRSSVLSTNWAMRCQYMAWRKLRPWYCSAGEKA